MKTTDLDVRGFILTLHPDRRLEVRATSSPADVHMAIRDGLGGPSAAVTGLDCLILPEHLLALLEPEIVEFLLSEVRGAAAFSRATPEPGDEVNYHATALVRGALERTVAAVVAHAEHNPSFSVEAEVTHSPEVVGPMTIVTGTNDFLALL